jgi:predicted short-subunit dehydrogenase-like oxidoreductase (DUF2520 family)
VADVGTRTFRVIGPGRAGGAMQRALTATGAWRALAPLGRGDDPRRAAADVDLVVIATPDRSIAEVAQAIDASPSTVVAHLSGACGLTELAPHRRRAALHPLMTLPDAERGAARLRGAWFAVAGDPLVLEVVAALEGRPFHVADASRAVYHAAACVASNHTTALLAQVERLAATAGVPFAAFFDLVRASVDNSEQLGPRRALTGPAARGDDTTIERHLAVLDDRERPAYQAMVAEIRRLVS